MTYLDLSHASDEADLVTYLLDGALTATHTIERLEQLAASCPQGDVAAAAQIADAIELMTSARASLLTDADRLSKKG